MSIEYRTAPNVVLFFQTFVDVGEYIEFVIKKLVELKNSNKNNTEWISPVVYSRQGKVFNIDYNFLIICLSEWTGKDAIEGDFLLTETATSQVIRNGMFLIVAIFENYYNLVRVRQKTIDLTKFKTMRSFNITDKFYNVMVIQNGDNFKRFSAIPFSDSMLKSIISAEDFETLSSVSDRDEYVQVAFGINQFHAFVEKHGLSPKYVFC